MPNAVGAGSGFGGTNDGAVIRGDGRADCMVNILWRVTIGWRVTIW